MFRYQTKQNSDELLIANDGDSFFSSTFQRIQDDLSQLGTLNKLDFAQIYPQYWVETKEQIAQRENFDLKEWIIAACILKGDDIKNVLIVNKKNHNLAYVIDYRKLAAYYCVYSAFLVEDGNAFLPIEEYLQSINAISIRDNEPAILDHADDDFVMPNLDFGPRFEGYSKKKIPTIVPKKQQPKIEPIEEAVEKPIKSPTPAFSAGKKKKIPNLGDVSFPKKPKPSYQPKPQPKPEQPEGEEEQIDESSLLEVQKRILSQSGFQASKKRDFYQKPIQKPEKPKIPQNTFKEIAKPAFIPASKSVPKRIGDEIFFHRSYQEVEFRHSSRIPNSKMIFRSAFHPEDESLFKRLDSILGQIKRFKLTSEIIFAPSLFPEGDSMFELLENFDLSQWRILCACVDGMNKPYTAALSLIEEPNKCFIVTFYKGPEILSVTKNGFKTSRPYRSFDEVLDICNRVPLPKKEEPVVEAPIVETPAEPEPENHEEAVSIPIADFVIEKRDKPHRKLFVTELFRRQLEDFASSHPKVRDDFIDLCEKLICYDDDSLHGFLSSRDNKKLMGLNAMALTKFRFSNSNEYYGARVFFLRGYDAHRRMDEKSIILVGLSNEDEHDEQSEVGERIASYIEKRRDDVILHEIILPENKNEEPEEVAYLSRQQIELLDDSRINYPAAFCGSAGTGKTLLSISNFIDLYQIGRVLYVTYQDDLCDYVYKTIENFGIENPDCLTFQKLCARLFSNSAEMMQRHCGRDDFREWFLNSHNMTMSFRTIAAPLGDTDDERFMTAYVFYNGVISGSMECLESKNGRLSLEKFLKLTDNEKGYDRAARTAAFKIGELYDRYLSENNLVTDNDLARILIKHEGKLRYYDSIIIDEYQDLSELQFRAILTLFKLTNSLPLFIYGDDNQSVNPTIFNHSQATAIASKAFKMPIKVKVHWLNESYRSGNSLVRFINEFNSVKKSCIGSLKKGNEAPEVSKRSDDDDLLAVLIRDENTFRQAVELAAKSDRDTVFVFPEAKYRDEAQEKYKSIDEQFVLSSFLSVEQAKGREWDTVVLVDFFSSSRDLFVKILGEDKAGKHSTLHRMLFNRFYVALTRAKNRIIVFESNSAPIIDERILSHLTPLPNGDELRRYFAGVVDEKHWIAFGDRRFRKGDYEGALRAYGRVHDSEEAKAKLQKTLDYQFAAQKKTPHDKAIGIYIRYNDYIVLREFYKTIGAVNRYAFLRAVMDPEEPENLLELYKQCVSDCNPEERKTFFYLASSRLAEEIRKKAKKHKRR